VRWVVVSGAVADRVCGRLGTVIRRRRGSLPRWAGRRSGSSPGSGSRGHGRPYIGCTLSDVTRLWTGLALALGAFALAGCGGNAATPAQAQPEARCAGAKLAGWRRLADRIDAAVYCPTWLPDPLDGAIGSRWNNIDSVSKDRSYLESWVWQETGLGVGGGELHVNLRGYPGRTAVPTCRNADTEQQVPCFSDTRGTKRFGLISATLYTVGRDADQWHVSYGWRYGGAFYTLSEHVAPPLNYAKVVRNLDRMMRSLDRVEPST
jgi:hypothetical protein